MVCERVSRKEPTKENTIQLKLSKNYITTEIIITNNFVQVFRVRNNGQRMYNLSSDDRFEIMIGKFILTWKHTVLDVL